MNANEVDLPPGTHPREIFRKNMPNAYHQQILEEVYNLADDRELRYPLKMAVVELPRDRSKGWGGQGRVLFIGDSAHAMRPASGLGGSMAFEDAVVLCRLLESCGSESLKTKQRAETLIRQFEEKRFERVKIIWDNQWELSEGLYEKRGSGPSVSFTPAFASWVREGV